VHNFLPQRDTLTILLASASIFQSLRFIPAGHRVPLYHQKQSTNLSPYQHFFHVYKPSTSFRKTAPPPPDFSVVVVKYWYTFLSYPRSPLYNSGRTTRMPSLDDLTTLFENLPERPDPIQRRRKDSSKRPIPPGALIFCPFLSRVSRKFILY